MYAIKKFTPQAALPSFQHVPISCIDDIIAIHSSFSHAKIRTANPDSPDSTEKEQKKAWEKSLPGK
jgi:hypothetical protein